MCLVLVQVSERNFNNTSLKVVGRNVYTRGWLAPAQNNSGDNYAKHTGSDGLVDDRLANVAGSEDGGGFDVIPLLAGEGIDAGMHDINYFDYTIIL